MTPTWVEHAAFWSGVRRATIAPRSQNRHTVVKSTCFYTFIRRKLIAMDAGFYSSFLGVMRFREVSRFKIMFQNKESDHPPRSWASWRDSQGREKKSKCLNLCCMFVQLKTEIIKQGISRFDFLVVRDMSLNILLWSCFTYASNINRMTHPREKKQSFSSPFSM